MEQKVEVCDSGVRLAYDRHHREDDYGVLPPDPLLDAEWAEFEIDLETHPHVEVTDAQRPGRRPEQPIDSA